MVLKPHLGEYPSLNPNFLRLNSGTVTPLTFKHFLFILVSLHQPRVYLNFNILIRAIFALDNPMSNSRLRLSQPENDKSSEYVRQTDSAGIH